MEKGCYYLDGWIVDKYGLHIRVSSITSFKYDEAFKYTILCIGMSEYQISDTDKSFYNLLLSVI
jgi:hypothetical protein